MEDRSERPYPRARSIADGYLAGFGESDIVRPSELWLVDADRWVRTLKSQSVRELQQFGLKRGPNIDHLRVGALNHLVKNFGPAALPPARIFDFGQ